ncbi:MAG: glutathione S-transferase [Gammaproteobacteria bacterium]|nr:glutathione S-transferase [Gammaproteobacteria bacterium]
MTSLPILYSFRRCPYAIRARMALAYSGIRVELREVKLSHKPDELLKISRKATVPVLVLDNGDVLEESIDIMRWALSVNDPEHWLVEDREGLIRENDEVFKPLLDRYKYADRFPELTADEHRQAALPLLRRLNRILAGDKFLSGEKLSLVDVAIMPFVRQFVGVEPRWFEQSEFEFLRHWLRSILASELFGRVMLKVDFWKTGDEVVYF